MLFNNRRFDMMDGNCCQDEDRSMNSPITEPVQERCVHRTFVHEVPHICPIRTRIINHHIYRHTYRPEFSCVEENVATQEDNGSCCNFR